MKIKFELKYLVSGFLMFLIAFIALINDLSMLGFQSDLNRLAFVVFMLMGATFSIAGSVNITTKT